MRAFRDFHPRKKDPVISIHGMPLVSLRRCPFEINGSLSRELRLDSGERWRANSRPSTERISWLSPGAKIDLRR